MEALNPGCKRFLEMSPFWFRKGEQPLRWRVLLPVLHQKIVTKYYICSILIHFRKRFNFYGKKEGVW